MRMLDWGRRYDDFRVEFNNLELNIYGKNGKDKTFL